MINEILRPDESSSKTFHKDQYATEAMIWIDNHGINEGGQQFLIFDDQIFYPHGGGQKGDRGHIDIPGDVSDKTGLPATVAIIDTRKQGDSICHILETPIDEEILDEYIIGDRKFRVQIDWDFRYKQMKLHSTAHLLHCFLEKVLQKSIDFPSYSELMEDFGINRYPEKDFLTTNQLEEILSLQNNWTTQGHRINTYANDDSQFPDWYRWWECGEFKIPCGGVHPNATEEIGDITAEIKIKKGNTSICFSLV